MKQRNLVLISLTAALLVPAFASAEKKTAANGKVVFETNCASCHGNAGAGDGPAAVALNPKPRNFTTDEFKAGSAPKDIFKTVTDGLPGTMMVSFKHLPEADRKAVAEYVSKTLAAKNSHAKSAKK